MCPHARFARERDNSAHLRGSRVTRAASSLKHGAAPECLHSGTAVASVQVGPGRELGWALIGLSWSLQFGCGQGSN